jgi:hypothetical protein
MEATKKSLNLCSKISRNNALKIYESEIVAGGRWSLVSRGLAKMQKNLSLRAKREITSSLHLNQRNIPCLTRADIARRFLQTQESFQIRIGMIT